MRTYLALLLLMQVLTGCAEATAEIEITQDQLGAVEGDVYLSFLGLTWPAGELVNDGAVATCHYADFGEENVAVFKITGGLYNRTIRASYDGGYVSDVYNACQGDPLCATQGSARTTLDGQYSMSNLLVGPYTMSSDSGYGALDLECLELHNRDLGDDDWSERNCTSATDPMDLSDRDIAQQVGSGTILDWIFFVRSNSINPPETGSGFEPYDDMECLVGAVPEQFL